MGLVDELGTFLDAQSTRFTAAVNLFGNVMPDEPNTATAITEYPGGTPAQAFQGDLPLYENARVAVTCRSSASTVARANINAAWVGLQRITNESLSGVSWLRCSAVQSPFLLRRDSQGRVEYQVNFDCARRTTST